MTPHCTRCERDGKPEQLACLVAVKDDKRLSVCYTCALAAIEAGYTVEADLSGCVVRSLSLDKEAAALERLAGMEQGALC